MFERPVWLRSRLSGQTHGEKRTVSYTYLANDRPQTLTPGGGPTATYAYYPDDSLNTVTWSPLAQPFKYTYNLSGQYDVLTFPNGQTRTFSYDDQGRPTGLANVLSGTNLATFSYGYDFNYYTSQNTMLGQRTSLTASVPSQGFTNALTKHYYDSLQKGRGRDSRHARCAAPGATRASRRSRGWRRITSS